jgi:3-carboxy-cis,cis-muconate cycloisomerase
VLLDVPASGGATWPWHHPRVMLRDTFASSAISACFDDASLVAAMLAFERALARAEARTGVIPAQAAEGIEAGMQFATFDVDALATDARRAGTLAIPFVKTLTAAVAAHDADAARYVHWGATSQDVLDTALALRLREATRPTLAALDRLGDAVATLAAAHRATAMAARTLLQPATPVPFGWKAAVWLDALARARRAFAHAAGEAAVLQFGGASGVRASLGAAGDAVARALADELGIGLPEMPWHSVRDRVARVGSELGIVCGIASKIAGDVMLMMQPEVGEAFEPSGAGRGGSSALPHKRNPVGSMLAREAALRAAARRHAARRRGGRARAWPRAVAGTVLDAGRAVRCGGQRAGGDGRSRRRPARRCRRDAAQPRRDARVRLCRGAVDGIGREARQVAGARACRGAVPAGAG